MTDSQHPPVRVALVGCGYWGINLCRAMAGSGVLDLRWVCDAAPQSRARAERLSPSSRSTDTIDEVLADDGVEAVAIATPVDSHATLATQVLQSGRHAFVEKPLARSVAAAEALCEVAETSGKVLMVGHTFLYNGAVRRVKSIIDSGDLGEIRYVFCRRLNLGIVRHDVDALWNLAPHDLSILNYWIDRPIADVSAAGHAFLQPGIADVVFAHLTYEGNVAGHVQVSWLDPAKVRQATVVGSRKMLVYDDVSSDARIVVLDKGIDVSERSAGVGAFETYAEHRLVVRAGDVWIPQVEFPEPLTVEVEEFADSIREDRAPLTDARSGLDVVRVLERISSVMDVGSPL